MLAVSPCLALRSDRADQDDAASSVSQYDCPTPDAQGPSRKRRAPGESPEDYLLSQSASPCDSRLISWLSTMYAMLGHGLEQLYRLHPACKLIPSETIELGLEVFRQYAAAVGLLTQVGAAQPFLYRAAISVCLWVSIKFLANPAVVPNANWIAVAFGVPVKLVLALEPEVLRAVDFNLLGICRASGLAPCEPQEADQE